VELTQGFDAAGRRTLLGAEVNNAGDLQDRFFYDNLGRMTKIERDSAPEFRVDFAYNAIDQFTSIKRYKDLDGGASNLVIETSYTYDNIGRLTDLTHFEDTTTFADYGWTYDSFSRVTAFTYSHLVGGSGTAEYVYDNTSQLTGADHSNQSDETYTYDASGNRTISGYTTGDANRLTSDGVFNFAYDDEGNRISDTRISSASVDDKTIEYAYDHRNRLTGVTYKNNAGTVTKSVAYVYDVWDRRIEKTYDADGAGGGSAVITRWAYDGQNILLTVDATGLVTHRYVHGPAADMVLADDATGAERYFPLTDNLGTVRDVIDHSGNVENHIDYNAFGRVTNETTAAFDFLFGYTGFERDEETGLNHSDTRYYDAVHARWTQEDWIGFRGGDYNLNRYVYNTPSILVDPSGLAGDSARAAEGRVAGAAIEEALNAAEGSRHQWPVRNVDGSRGNVDVLAGGSRTIDAEIGAASPTGVHDKAAQAAKRRRPTSVILFRQTGCIPSKGDTVDFVELSQKQARELELEAKAKNWNSNQIWKRAQELGKKQSAVVSEKAARQGKKTKVKLRRQSADGGGFRPADGADAPGARRRTAGRTATLDADAPRAGRQPAARTTTTILDADVPRGRGAHARGARGAGWAIGLAVIAWEWCNGGDVHGAVENQFDPFGATDSGYAADNVTEDTDGDGYHDSYIYDDGYRYYYYVVEPEESASDEDASD